MTTHFTCPLKLAMFFFKFFISNSYYIAFYCREKNVILCSDCFFEIQY